MRIWIPNDQFGVFWIIYGYIIPLLWGSIKTSLKVEIKLVNFRSMNLIVGNNCIYADVDI